MPLCCMPMTEAVVQVAVNQDEGSLSGIGNAMGLKSALLSRLLQAAAAAQVRTPLCCCR